MITTDPQDPRLQQKEDGKQNEVYLVLSEEERAKGFVRPYRDTYVHTVCGTATKMGRPIAETYAVKPWYYGSTWCIKCCHHLPVGEFVWEGTEEILGS